MTHFNIIVNVTPKEIEKLMTSLQSLTVAINGLQTAVALIPAGAPVAGDPGATAAQVTAAATAIAAQTAILTADVAGSTTPPGVPLAPTGVAAVSNGGGSVTLSWTPVSGATSYIIEQSLTSGAGFVPGTSIPAPAATTPPSLVSATVSGLTVGTPIFFDVFAVSAAGTSVSSAEVTIVP